MEKMMKALNEEELEKVSGGVLDLSEETEYVNDNPVSFNFTVNDALGTQRTIKE